ncbi:MAG TPA: DNA primase [Isosphaeraceae bacterium]|nr:DNA primase [Isosphaeraceae bacterium]
MPKHSEATLAAIKQAVDIVQLVGEYLTLHRSGAKFKALCPFHDDHNPSLILDPERQSFKCWSCGAGGDVFDFVRSYERVEFPEALRMLAERAGVALDTPDDRREARKGPSKSDLLAAAAWAEGAFAAALRDSAPARAYVQTRGLSAESVARFRLGFAPEDRGWLQARARRDGVTTAALEGVGLILRSPESPGTIRDRFHGRLIFPIHDLRGRPIGFGGRILPEAEERLAGLGRRVAKYLNSPETPLFQKRRTLYAADLARAASRSAGWVAVVEGYTDVIAAHQVGVANVVGTLGTALGDDHVLALRRLADRVVLIFDGDEAGQKAADRALELFLGHEIDARVLTLPDGLDPCDFLLKEGADAFRGLVDQAVDPLDFAIERATTRFDLDSPEEARRAAESVLAVLAKVPAVGREGLGLKLGVALDKLARRLGLPVDELRPRLRQLRRDEARRLGKKATTTPNPTAATEPAAAPMVSEDITIRPEGLDPLDRELVRAVLNEPTLVGPLVSRVAAGTLRDAPLRRILQACYDLYGEGQAPEFIQLASRIGPAERSLAAGLLLPADRSRLPEGLRPASWAERLAGVLVRIDERDWRARVRDLKGALDETDPAAQPDEHRALHREYLRTLSQPPTPRH